MAEADPVRDEFRMTYDILGRDYINAGKASTGIKDILKEMGLRSDLVRRVAIAAYEAEMNVVMYAMRGSLTLRVTPRTISMRLEDLGPGIPDIEQAMQEGFSTASPEIREMGFGAGMGLPNIKRNSDRMEIRSTVGRGTCLTMEVDLG
jgi:serine/threonine-protein kinase RsbT